MNANDGGLDRFCLTGGHRHSWFAAEPVAALSFWRGVPMSLGMARALFAALGLWMFLTTCVRAVVLYPHVVIDSVAVAAKSLPSNSFISPGEWVTFEIGLRNAGLRRATNITAELVSTPGLTNLGAVENFFDLETNGAPVTRFFSVEVGGPVGRIRQGELVVRSSGAEIGRVVFDVPVGSNAYTFRRLERIWVPADAGLGSGPASVFPSTAAAQGVLGSIGEVRLTLHNLSHEFPEDVNAVLVSPKGTAVMAMSDCGGGFTLTNVNLTFASGVSNQLANSLELHSGVYAATDINLPNRMTAPAPTNLPAGTVMGSYTKEFANGEWQLFLEDVRELDSGAVHGGWTLSFVMQFPPTLFVRDAGNGNMVITVANTGRRTFLIDVSTNLVTWETIGQTPSTLDTVTFTESTAGDRQRFYRARRVTP
jgi:hypothetical protein